MSNHETPPSTLGQPPTCPYCGQAALNQHAPDDAEYTLVGHLLHDCDRVPEDVANRINTH